MTVRPKPDHTWRETFRRRSALSPTYATKHRRSPSCEKVYRAAEFAQLENPRFTKNILRRCPCGYEARTGAFPAPVSGRHSRKKGVSNVAGSHAVPG